MLTYLYIIIINSTQKKSKREHYMKTIGNTKGLNSNSLKLLAVIAMICQHSAIFFMHAEGLAYYLLFCFGMLTAPIMCYFIAEGYHHTHDLKRYMGRLLLGALISHVPHALACGFPILEFWKYTSVMWSLFLGLLALSIWERKSIHWFWRLALVGLCCILAYPGNWNFVAVIWIVGFGAFRDQPVKKWGAFLFGWLIHVALFFVVSTNGTLWTRFAVLAAIPILLLYNGQRGRKSKLFQPHLPHPLPGAVRHPAAY